MTPFAAETTAARAAQVAWAALPLRQRLRPVRELRVLLVERRAALTVAIEADVERPPAEVIATDVLPSASACKYLLTDAAGKKPAKKGLDKAAVFAKADTNHDGTLSKAEFDAFLAHKSKAKAK